MSPAFITYFRHEMEPLQQHAREHRQGNDKNRAELDRRISIMLRRFYPEVEAALGSESEDANVEQRRQEHLRWKAAFLKYTSVVKFVVMALALGLILAVGIWGSGSPESQLAYKVVFVGVVLVFAVTAVILYRFKQSTKEFLIENILAYKPEEV